MRPNPAEDLPKSVVSLVSPSNGSRFTRGPQSTARTQLASYFLRHYIPTLSVTGEVLLGFQFTF